MIVFLNSKLVPGDQAVISVFDRGFLYGDGIFETLRVAHGRPFRWDQHWARFRAAAAELRLAIPYDAVTLLRHACELASANGLADGFLRLTLSRGTGPRGYSPKGAGPPTCVMSLHPLQFPAGPCRLATIRGLIPEHDYLGHMKTASKMLQIVGRMRAEELGADEALLVKPSGRIAEGASANVFWVRGSVLHTPPLGLGILPGVTRSTVAEIAGGLGLDCRETEGGVEELRAADGVMLTLSTTGVWPVRWLDREELGESSVVERLAAAYEQLIESETR